MRQVFGGHAPGLAVSATKSMHGHLLGAAGAIEALVTVLALREGAIPPTAHLRGNLDPAEIDAIHQFGTHPFHEQVSIFFATVQTCAKLGCRHIEG